ncbi:ATP-binding protein [soil metagenome]
MPPLDSPLDRTSTAQAGVDIAARTTLAESQRTSRIYEAMLSSITDFIYAFDRAGRFVYVNHALLSLWGLERSEAVGKNFTDLKYEPDLAAKLQSQIQQVFDTGQGLSDVTPYTSPTGAGGFYEYIFTPVLAPDGTVELVSGSTRDISEHRNVLQALQRSEESFRQLADAMPQIVWAAKPDGTLDYYNRRWFDYINLAGSDMEQARWDKYIHAEDVARVYAAWNEAVQTGQPYGIEFRICRADGVYRWFLVRAMPIRDAHDTVARWFGTCTDIQVQKELLSQREQLLEAERAARSEAERLSRMKDEFLATLSHELRTPLTAILGWAQIINRPAAKAEDVSQGVDVIQRNARAQAQIIEDLLDMSRIISGKVRLETQPLDLVAIVQAAVEAVRPAADGKGIRLKCAITPLPNLFISGDANRIQQVLWNLLTNALKFTPKGGSVEARFEYSDTHAEISVVDSGDGIKPEFLPYVFDRFRQADATTTRRHGGLGLGLSIVKQLTELHGGSVRVTSPGIGYGSTFVVALPLARVHGAPQPRIEPHPQKAVESTDRPEAKIELDGVRVLVVDDEPDTRILIKRLLEDSNATVTFASTVDEAIRLLQAGLFNVLLSDIGMPGEDGYTLIRRVRALGKSANGNIPAIALTAYARAEDRVKAIAAGFLMHVAKPVEPIELITMVAGAAGRTGR